jgi:hypothetical protein
MFDFRRREFITLVGGRRGARFADTRRALQSQSCGWPRHSGAAKVAPPRRRGDRMKRREFIIGSISLWMSTPSFAQNTYTAKVGE